MGEGGRARAAEHWEMRKREGNNAGGNFQEGLGVGHLPKKREGSNRQVDQPGCPNVIFVFPGERLLVGFLPWKNLGSRRKRNS